MKLLEDPSGLKDWKQEVLSEMKFHLTRREMLKAALVGAGAMAFPYLVGRSRVFAASPATTQPQAVKTGTFFFPRLSFHVKDETGDVWNVYPVADVRLRKRLTELTNINASQDPVVIQLSDLDKMCRYPFIFATSEGYFDIPKDEQKNLKEYLLRGGFIHADDCVHRSAKGKTTPSDLVNGVFKPRQRGDKIDGDRFFSDHLKNLQELLPEHSIVKLPNDHELYHCYFDFPDGCPHLQGVNHGGWGLIEKGTGRIMSLATPGDLHCGWTGMFFTAEQNEAAMKMGVNIIIYYLTH